MEKNNAEKFIQLIKNKELNNDELKEKLIDMYKNSQPPFAEIVMNSFCPNKCLHCIYPSDYHLYNKNLDFETWKPIFDNLYSKLGYRHFIISGRSLNQTIIKIVDYLNKKYSDIKIGLIADGPIIKKFYDDLKNIKLYNLDISVDGLKEGHEKQRNFVGSYDLTIEMIKKLLSDDGPVKNGNIQKLTILSTLTTINHKEIIPMIKYFNKEIGLKNFFITPVSRYSGRPDKSLELSFEELGKFIIDIIKEYKNLDDTFINFGVYRDDIIIYLKNNIPEIYNKLKPIESHFEFVEEFNNNIFNINWLPISLVGCQEFIINSNGDIMPPYVMAEGKINEKYVFGNVLNIQENKEEFFKKLADKQVLNFYYDYLIKFRNEFNK